MPQPQTIHIYAEILANIRFITVAVSLPNRADETTLVEVDASGLALSVYHQGHGNGLRLPQMVASFGAQPVSEGRATLSVRLPLDAARASNDRLSLDDPEVPWTSNAFGADCEVSCRDCQTLVLKKGEVRAWKDLPSENWAEMMEFWHCHRPHNPDDGHEEPLVSRELVAQPGMSAQKGLGMVDVTSILLAEDDTSCLSYSTVKSSDDAADGLQALTFNEHLAERKTKTQKTSVSCSICGNGLGVFDAAERSIRLFKWTLALRSSPSSRPRSQLPSLPNCLAALLLTVLTRSGMSKTILWPESLGDAQADGRAREATGFHLWVFNRDLSYVSTEMPKGARATKLLYRPIDHDAATKILEANMPEANEFRLPVWAIEDVVKRLDQSRLLLPRNFAQLGDWKIALCDWWEGP